MGRGLSSLIGETKIDIQKNKISISDLVPNKYQPRKIFDEDNLNDLNSIQLKKEASYNQSLLENLMMIILNMK